MVTNIGYQLHCNVSPIENLKYANFFHRRGQENLRPEWRMEDWSSQLAIYETYHLYMCNFSIVTQKCHSKQAIYFIISPLVLIYAFILSSFLVC